MARDVTPTNPDRPMSAAEFCALQRALVDQLVMRKKRKVAMEPIQAVKRCVLDLLEAEVPTEDEFPAALARAVQALGEAEGGATGPAQAVASDLEMDWQMVRLSATYVDWLRQAAHQSPTAAEPLQADEESPQPDSNRRSQP